ncbi:hypothetical protein ACET3Z_031422 [Daucus carota]
MDMSGNHSPLKNTTNNEVPTEIIDTKSKVDTPLSGNSTNKTKPRFTDNLDKSQPMDFSGNVTPLKSTRDNEVPTEIPDTHVQQTEPKVDTPLATYASGKTRPRLNVSLDKSEEPVVKQPRVHNIKKEKFLEALDKVTEDPIILIITSARVTNYHEQIDICNYSPTIFYINYDHHTVHKLRKDYQNPDFNKKQISTRTKSLKLLTVEQIKNLEKDSIQDEVVCKAVIKTLEEYSSWKYFVCTSCYGKDDGIAELLEKLNGKGCTIKVSISQANVEKKDKVFLATDAFSGFDYEETKGGQREIQEKSESFTAQVTINIQLL